MSKIGCGLLLIAVIAGIASHCEAQDISRLLADSAFVDRQVKCVLREGPCDRTGQQLLDALPEVLRNNCARCNANQAANARKLINFMKERYPREWEIIRKRHGANL